MVPQVLVSDSYVACGYRLAIKYGRLLYMVATFGVSQTTLCTAILSNNSLQCTMLKYGTTGDSNNYNACTLGSPETELIMKSTISESRTVDYLHALLTPIATLVIHMHDPFWQSIVLKHFV